jgi:hypothetical protein
LRIFRRTPAADLWIAIAITMIFILPLPDSIVSNLAPDVSPKRIPTTYALIYFYFWSLGAIALITFWCVFTVGAYYFYLKRQRQWATSAGLYSALNDETKMLRKELADVTESIAETAHKLSRESNPNKRIAIESSLRTLQDSRRDIQERLRELQESSTT